MKTKLWLFLAIGMLAIIFATPAWAEFRWGDHNIGTNPLMPMPIESPQLLAQGIKMRQAQIGAGLSGRVPGDPFLGAVHLTRFAETGRIRQISLPPGTKFPFMISAGGVNVDVVWIGPSNLEGWAVGDFVVARRCGNLVPFIIPQPVPQLVQPPPPPPEQPIAYYPPPQPQPYYQQPVAPVAPMVSFGWGMPCGGSSTTKIQANQTYISNIDARSVTQTDASYRAWNNNNPQTNTYAPYNQQSWNYQPTTTTTTTTQQRGYNPPTQPTTPYCPPGQPAGRGGGGYNYTQPVLTGSALPGNNGSGNPNLGSALPGTGTRAALTGSSLGSALPGNNGSGNPALGSALPGSGTRATLPGSSLGSALPGNNGSGNPVLGSALPGRR